MKKLLPSLLLGLLVLASPAMALDFDFNGTFTHDNDIALSSFTVGSSSTVTIFTSSWRSGGFDPILTLWNGSGNFIFEQDDGGTIGSAVSNAVSYTYGQWDSYFTYHLLAGTYTVSIAQYNNYAVGPNLSNGFQQAGNPNFTFDYGWGTQLYFNGSLNDNDARTGNWALHVLHVNPAPIPSVPDDFPTLPLLGVAILALAGLKRRFT